MRIVIVGCGRVGGGLARILAPAGHAVSIVDKHPTAFERLGRPLKVRTVVGDGLDREVLLQAGIERADGLATVTAGDDMNVVIARIARQVFKVPRVVARVYDPRKAEIYRRLGVQTIAPTTWGAGRMAELLTYSELNTVLTMGNGEVEMVEAEIPALLDGRPVSQIAVPGEVHVVSISREGRSFLPTAGTTFHKNDRVLLAVVTTSAARVPALLGLA